ncbi:MAG: VIT1/CCC1 transporter family protein [Candidatus Heimdallarchaeota archaeon]
MKGLNDEERRRLLNAAKEIHTHKLVQIKGYRILVKRASDERIKNLLIRICEEEEKHAEFWVERIEKLGGPQGGTTYKDWKVRLMMSILGTKGFFEWAVVGEEDGIHDLIIQAGKIRDSAASETWSRFASDERLHLERIKTEVLGMEHWEIRGMIGEMILGANDGLVSILASVAGVAGVYPNTYLVLLAGIAGLFAGTFSMGVSSYQSTKSELEVLEREQEREVTKGKAPAEEREELIKFYQTEGFKKGEAEAIVARILSQQEQPMHADILDKLGLVPKEIGNPSKAGFLTGLSFAISALIPIIPFVLDIDPLICLGISVVITLAALFGVGAMKTIFSRKNWIRSGLEMMVIGASAAVITFVIGYLADKYLLGV